ncbi:unnamed protein product [Caenorhabditis brenneri]
MKFLLTALLLVHTAQCLPEFSRASCLQFINTARGAVAEKLQIANMNSLNYEKILETAILKQLSFVDECPEPSIISHKGLDIYLNVQGNEELIVELLTGTGNTVLACVKSKCNGEPIVSIVTDVSDSAPIAGSPGTECPSDRFANSKGLCASKKASRPSRKFVDDFLGTVGDVLLGPVVDVVKETAEELAKRLAKEAAEAAKKAAELARDEALKMANGR